MAIIPVKETFTVLTTDERLGLASPLVEITVNKLYQHEIAEARSQLEQLEADLAEFETQYEITSNESYMRFQDGTIGDDMDYIEWSSLFQMTTNLRRRLDLLTSEKLS